MANSAIPTAILNNTGVTAGTYGNAAQMPVITVTPGGRISVANSSTIAGAIQGVVSFNNSQLGGYKNLVINGAMQIWQRGTSFAIGTGATVTYTADRWAAYRGGAGGGNSTVSRQASGLAGFQYSLRFQRNAGDTGTIQATISRPFTSAESQRFQGKFVTLSFWARSGANFSAPSLGVQVSTGTGSDQPFVPAGFTGQISPLNTGILITNTWQRWTLTSASVCSSTLNQMGVGFVFNPTGTAGANDWFEITGVQIEEGPTATAFENIPFDVDFQRCLPFYEKSFPYATAPAQNSGTLGSIITCIGSGAVANTFSIPFKVKKRISPTMTFFNPSAANAFIRNLNTSTDFTSTALDAAEENRFSIFGSAPTGSGTGQRLALNWTANAELG